MRNEALKRGEWKGGVCKDRRVGRGEGEKGEGRGEAKRRGEREAKGE